MTLFEKRVRIPAQLMLMAFLFWFFGWSDGFVAVICCFLFVLLEVKFLNTDNAFDEDETSDPT